jgi:hypothetical protein
MNIYTVECEESYCALRHYTAQHRAEAAKTAHQIALGHEAAVSEVRVEFSA